MLFKNTLANKSSNWIAFLIPIFWFDRNIKNYMSNVLRMYVTPSEVCIYLIKFSINNEVGIDSNRLNVLVKLLRMNSLVIWLSWFSINESVRLFYYIDQLLFINQRSVIALLLTKMIQQSK